MRRGVKYSTRRPEAATGRISKDQAMCANRMGLQAVAMLQFWLARPLNKSSAMQSAAATYFFMRAVKVFKAMPVRKRSHSAGFIVDVST